MVLGLVLAAGLGGCGESVTRPLPTDAGPRVDAPVLPGDADGDRLCDSTEAMRGTDPFNPDTDGDGYTDYVEIVYGYDPLRPASPDRATVVLLGESPEASSDVMPSLRVRGQGEDYTGSFEALPVHGDIAGLTASAFNGGGRALFADPVGNVGVVEEEAERFRGVVGTTLLAFEQRLVYGDNVDGLCARAYPFRYIVKRSDGALVYAQRYLLVVLPVGERLTADGWCIPSGGCR